MLLDMILGQEDDRKDQYGIPDKWKNMAMVHDNKIRDLIEVFFEIVYPM